MAIVEVKRLGATKSAKDTKIRKRVSQESTRMGRNENGEASRRGAEDAEIINETIDSQQTVDDGVSASGVGGAVVS